MSLERCDRCKRILPMFGRTCGCERFECAIDYSPRGKDWEREPREDEWTDVYATDAEDAAERFAARYDCEGDYTIIKNSHGRVWVRNSENEISRWDIEAEAVPNYYAREVVATSKT